MGAQMCHFFNIKILKSLLYNAILYFKIEKSYFCKKKFIIKKKVSIQISNKKS